MSPRSDRPIFGSSNSTHVPERRGKGRPPAAVRFQRPALPSSIAIERYLESSRADRWFSNGGPCCRMLAERLADRVGAYCVPVASGTLGLMAAMASILGDPSNSGQRGGALMPSFTFLATAQAALWAGLDPQLIDVDPGHWHLDPASLEKLLGGSRNDLRLVVAVSTFGTPPPSEARGRWEQACRRAGIPLVVDSAAAFGAIADDGTPIGAQGDIEVVSFHATKPFAIGEGGAIFTKSRELYERIELAVNFGLRRDRSVAMALGLNAKMSELHAATGLAVLDEYDSIMSARRAAAQRIRAAAAPGVAWQQESDRSTWQFVPVAFASAEERSRAIEACRGSVEVRVYYEPLHEMEPFAECAIAGGTLARTRDLASRVLCLPMANDLGDEEIDAISAVVSAEGEHPPHRSDAVLVQQSPTGV